MINVNMTDKAGVTLATAGKYCADNVKVTPSADILRKDEQAKTATPTTSTQDITPDAGKALSKVTVNPITAAIVGDLDAGSFASAIVAAIEGKGVDVPDGAKLDALAALVESIQAGGGDGGDLSLPSGWTYDYGSITMAEDLATGSIDMHLSKGKLEAGSINHNNFIAILFSADVTTSDLNAKLICFSARTNIVKTNVVRDVYVNSSGTLGQTSYGDINYYNNSSVQMSRIAIKCVESRQLLAGKTYHGLVLGEAIV